MKVTDISIIDYLTARGITLRKEGKFYLCSSPFAKDSTWSFCVYPTNSFYDWSTGFGGNIINLHSRLEGLSIKEACADLGKDKKYSTYTKRYEKVYTKKPFKIEDYINEDPKEIEAIQKYALSRGITQGYEPGVFYVGRRSRNTGLARIPAILFKHVDKNLNVCGVKLRRIDQGTPRFKAGGKLGMYVLEAPKHPGAWYWDAEDVLYVVEGEANANSLSMYLTAQGRPNVIISIGGVSRRIKKEDLPLKYQKLPIKLIIDYDGNEEIYQERLKLYSELGAEPIKIIMPKGEDINSLFAKNQMYLIENLL